MKSLHRSHMLTLFLGTILLLATSLPAQDNSDSNKPGVIIRSCQSNSNCAEGQSCDVFKKGLPGISEDSEAFINSSAAGKGKICLSPGDKGQSVKCSTGSNDCATGFMCVSVKAPELVGAEIKAPVEGGCASCIRESATCLPGQLSRTCCNGLTCLIKPHQNAGTCVSLPALSNEQMQEYGFIQNSGTNLECLYLPGNYYFFAENDAQCCGLPTPISIGDNKNTNHWLRFCGLVPPGNEKLVTDERFCAPSAAEGGNTIWEGKFLSNNNSAPIKGRCINPPKVSALGGLNLGPGPEYQFNQALCQAQFKEEDKIDREGLISAWPASNFYPLWETSWPDSGHHRPGDELYLMSFIWLFRNTDVDSMYGLNFKYKEFANKLYDSFEKYYSKGLIDSFEWIQQLERQKDCIDPSSPFAFQLRYWINENLIEGLSGTLLSFQCGGADKFDMTTGTCTDGGNPHFAIDFAGMNATALAEARICRTISKEGMIVLGALAALGDPIAMHMLAGAAIEGGGSECAKTKQLNNWKDGKRHKFYTKAAEDYFKGQSELEEKDKVINSMKAHFNNMGIDWLMDPAINTAWAPEEMFKDDIKGLWEKAKKQSKSELTKLDESEGGTPVFHWSLILQPEKFAEAFPDTSINGRRFLHIHEKMQFFNMQEKAKYEATIKGSVETDPKKMLKNDWDGPEALATEASHIMEHLAMADEDWFRRHRHLRAVYTDMVLKARLIRLMQYYDKKLEGLIQENECLKTQILAMAKTLGHDMAAFDIHTIYFKKENKCGNPLGGGGKQGDGDIDLDADLKIGSGSAGGPGQNNQGAQGEQGLTITGGGFNFAGGGKTSGTVQKSQGLSKSSVKGPLSSLNGNTQALGRAARKGMKDLAALLKKERDEFIADNGDHPAVQMAYAGFPSSGKRSGRGSASINAGSPFPSSMDLSGASAAAKRDGSGAGAKGSSADEKVNFNDAVGTVDFSGTDPAASGRPASKVTTGLPPEAQKQILSSITPKSVQIEEGDSLWIIINKTYIKSYKKLFESSK